MSSHRLQTNKFVVAIGVDHPLQHVFATVLTMNGKPARGFPVLGSFPMTGDGIQKAVGAVETFIQATELDWMLPEPVIQALHDDLEIVNEGGDIGSIHFWPSIASSG